MATIPLEFPSADLYYDLAKKTLFYVSCERQVFCVHVEEDNLRFPSLVREDSGEQGAPCEPLKVTSSRLRGYSDILSIEGSSENNVLFVGSTSGHIFQVDQNSGDTVCEWAVENKVDAAVVLKPWNNLLAVGYDSGRIRLWDRRQAKRPAYSYRGHSDSVTDILVREPRDTLDLNTVLSSGSDGTVSVFELRKSSTPVVTESIQDELTCLSLIKNSSILVCGTLTGDLIMFEWRLWDKLFDNCRGHPDAIGDMCSVDDNTLLTGSDDGLLRLINIHPNRMIGVLGIPFELPIEKLILDPISRTLVCSSYDSFIRCFDASCLYEKDISADIERTVRPSAKGKKRKASISNESVSSFFNDL